MFASFWALFSLLLWRSLPSFSSASAVWCQYPFQKNCKSCIKKTAINILIRRTVNGHRPWIFAEISPQTTDNVVIALDIFQVVGFRICEERCLWHDAKAAEIQFLMQQIGQLIQRLDTHITTADNVTKRNNGNLHNYIKIATEHRDRLLLKLLPVRLKKHLI